MRCPGVVILCRLSLIGSAKLQQHLDWACHTNQRERPSRLLGHDYMDSSFCLGSVLYKTETSQSAYKWGGLGGLWATCEWCEILLTSPARTSASACLLNSAPHEGHFRFTIVGWKQTPATFFSPSLTPLSLVFTERFVGMFERVWMILCVIVVMGPKLDSEYISVRRRKTHL